MTYERLATAVSDAGFYTTGDFDSRVICASKKRQGGGYTGNSFWIAKRASDWFLGTWGPHVYRIGDPERIPELCVTWLRRYPNSTASDVDDFVRDGFNLVEIHPYDFPDE